MVKDLRIGVLVRHWAEGVAKGFLEHLDYRILAENYSVRGGELDLVAQDGETLVFVEVRQRANARHGSPAESLQPQKLARLRNAALHYLVEHYGRDDLPLRFDAVLITGSREKHRLEHLKNAF